MIRLILIGIVVVIVLAILLHRKQPPSLLDEIRVIDAKDELRPRLPASEQRQDIVDSASERDGNVSDKRRNG